MKILKKKNKPDKNFVISAIITICFIAGLAGVYYLRNLGYSKDVILQKANNYFINERYFMAAKYYDKSYDLGASGAEFFRNYGIVLSKLGNYSSAEKYFQHSLEADGSNSETYYCLGDAFYQKAVNSNNKDDFLQAARYLEKAISLAPDVEKSYLLIGLCYRSCAMQENARAWYRRALLSGNFSQSGFYNLIGHTFREEERYLEAASYYKRAMESDYSFVAAYCNTGDMYVKLNDNASALTYYNKAIAVNPDFIVSYIKIGSIYFDQKLYNEAISWYLKALSVNPDSDKANYMLGLSYKEIGRINDAVEYLKKAAYCGSDDAIYELRNIGIELR
ncbi:MAG: tetratricopeptide repeat protein [Endomicrobium sp.]|jgi:tetratricopeptide (TPR) repeat protein|nr:tetratricopeptide repeat protein [Endomicrobium sp.]